MKVNAICTRDPVTIDAKQPLCEAAKLMRKRRVGTLVVTCSAATGTEVYGIVTDRDLVIDVMTQSGTDSSLQVADLAHTDLVMVDEHTELEDAISVMHEGGVRRLLVRDKDNRLCGLLSIDDVIQVLSEQLSRVAQTIRAGRDREIGRRPVVASVVAQPRLSSVSVFAWPQSPA